MLFKEGLENVSEVDKFLKTSKSPLSKNMIDKARLLCEKRRFYKDNRHGFFEGEFYRNGKKNLENLNINSNSIECKDVKEFTIYNLDIPKKSNLFKYKKCTYHKKFNSYNNKNDFDLKNSNKLNNSLNENKSSKFDFSKFMTQFQKEQFLKIIKKKEIFHRSKKASNFNFIEVEENCNDLTNNFYSRRNDGYMKIKENYKSGSPRPGPGFRPRADVNLDKFFKENEDKIKKSLGFNSVFDKNLKIKVNNSPYNENNNKNVLKKNSSLSLLKFDLSNKDYLYSRNSRNGSNQNTINNTFSNEDSICIVKIKRDNNNLLNNSMIRLDKTPINQFINVNNMDVNKNRVHKVDNYLTNYASQNNQMSERTYNFNKTPNKISEIKINRCFNNNKYFLSSTPLPLLNNQPLRDCSNIKFNFDRKRKIIIP